MNSFARKTSVSSLGSIVALALLFVVPLTEGQTQGSGAKQTEKIKTPEPEMLGVFCDLDPSTQTLKALPKEEFKKEVHHAWGSAFYRRATTIITVHGETSMFHIPAGRSDVFVIRTSAETALNIKLFPFKIKKNMREYELGVAHGYLLSGNVENEFGITVDVACYGDSLYKVTTPAPLVPGEYALTDGRHVFTFSIVAP
jgi:hypothetical protein